jgi:hypothetical protein
VLLIVIIGLGCCALFLASFASYQDFAVCLLLQSLLVESFGPDDHPDVVDTCVLRDVDLLFKLVSFMNRFQYFSFRIVRISISSACEKISLFRKN